MPCVPKPLCLTTSALVAWVDPTVFFALTHAKSETWAWRCTRRLQDPLHVSTRCVSVILALFPSSPSTCRTMRSSTLPTVYLNDNRLMQQRSPEWQRLAISQHKRSVFWF